MSGEPTYFVGKEWANDRELRLAGSVPVNWLCFCDLPFIKTRALTNPLNSNELLNKSEDGQEVALAVGMEVAKLCMDQEKYLNSHNQQTELKKLKQIPPPANRENLNAPEAPEEYPISIEEQQWRDKIEKDNKKLKADEEEEAKKAQQFGVILEERKSPTTECEGDPHEIDSEAIEEYLYKDLVPPGTFNKKGAHEAELPPGVLPPYPGQPVPPYMYAAFYPPPPAAPPIGFKEGERSRRSRSRSSKKRKKSRSGHHRR